MTTARLRARLLMVVALCVVGGALGTFVATQAPQPPGGEPAYDADAVVYGLSLGQWSARYWQWMVSFPIGLNPGQDPSGERCSVNQEGPAFFLPQNFPPCVVPAGMAIYVPIVGTECSTAEAPPYHGNSEAELRSCAKLDVDRYTGIIVRVDGKLVEDIEAYRAVSPVFSMTIPENNVLGAAPGTALAVADGYQLLLAPLPPGPHEIVVHVELSDGTVLPDKVARLVVV